MVRSQFASENGRTYVSSERAFPSSTAGRKVNQFSLRPNWRFILQKIKKANYPPIENNHFVMSVINYTP